MAARAPARRPVCPTIVTGAHAADTEGPHMLGRILSLVLTIVIIVFIIQLIA